MDYAVGMDIFERRGDLQGDPESTFAGELALLFQNLAQQPAVNPLHRHIELTVIEVGKNFHHAGMIEFFAYLLLALEAVVEDRIRFHLGVGNLDGDGLARALVNGTKNRGHAATGGNAFNAVMVELIASVEKGHEGKGKITGALAVSITILAASIMPE